MNIFRISRFFATLGFVCCRTSVLDNSCSKTMILFIYPAQKTESETCWYNSRFARGQTTRLQTNCKTVFSQQLICKTIQHLLDSYGDLGAGGKISASTVFDTIIHMTLLKYFKLMVTCDSLFKQTSKKEDPSSCCRNAPLENFTPEHRSDHRS